MYSLTLVAQPTRHREKLIETDSLLQFQNHEWMVEHYLPFQHLMMILSLVGLISAATALYSRWDSFSKKPFSPAHVAFCFPTLSHTNAVQAYRGAVNSFSSFKPGSPFKVALFSYWMFFLVGGTALNLVFSYMYICRLPEWTKLDTAGEEEPPDPENTFVHEMLDQTESNEMIVLPADKSFVNPAVLQANEAGALVRVRRGTEDFRAHGPYVRTRKVTALGFDPTMDEEELRREHAVLLDWVAKNAPRTRNRTMSNPLFLQRMRYTGNQVSAGRQGLATGQLDQTGAYGTFAGDRRPHKRSQTTTNITGI